MSLYINAADRAFVRHLIREMRAAIAVNPEAPTVTTGPLDPNILEHVLAVAMQNSARHAAPAEARSDLLKLAGDVRWRELAEGSQFTIIDRSMLGELFRLANALPTPPKAEAE